MLFVERELLISLLKLTENGAIEQEQLNTDSRLPSTTTLLLLEKLQKENLLYLKDKMVEVEAQSRLKLAAKAVQLGADIERVSNYLKWQEFEAMAALALDFNGYIAQKNVRFKHAGRRWEIDVVGCKKPLIVCIDCKHWHYGIHSSTIKKMAESQAVRVSAFADSLPNPSTDLPDLKWTRANFVPVILTLVPFRSKFCDNIPVVSVLQLQDFVSQLPLQVESLRYFSRSFSHL